jgi:hypothetical protein
MHKERRGGGGEFLCSIPLPRSTEIGLQSIERLLVMASTRCESEFIHACDGGSLALEGAIEAIRESDFGAGHRRPEVRAYLLYHYV